jgi:hypothetical protein
VGGRRKQASPKKRSRSRQQTADGLRLALKQERAERKQALERERATSEILRVIAESQTDAHPVFDTIVRNAVRLCGGMFANAFAMTASNCISSPLLTKASSYGSSSPTGSQCGLTSVKRRAERSSLRRP